MVTYNVNWTDITKAGGAYLSISDNEVNQDTSIALFGRSKLEYGQLMNENILHLLENFSCPESSAIRAIDGIASPDLSQATDATLHNAVNGQLWYNETNATVYVKSDIGWKPLSKQNEVVAANWGTAAHGEQLPKPVLTATGAAIDYEYCSWIVSPLEHPEEFSIMRCYTDSEANVVMEYTVPGSSTVYNGSVNYMIIGIVGNTNLGENILGGNIVAPSPTPTPTNTVTPTVTVGLTPTMTPTTTVTPTVTPTQAVTVTPTPTESAQVPAALGEHTRLYISPSPGDPGGPGPDAGGPTTITDTCGDSVTLTGAIQRSMYVSMQNISGGVGPYTVDFSNIVATVSSPATSITRFPGDPTAYNLPGTVTAVKSYSGGTAGGLTSIRTNVAEDELVYMQVLHQIDNTAGWYSVMDHVSYENLFISLQGRVVITDQLGASRTWWIPDTIVYSGGSNITTQPTETLIYTITWQHSYTCS